MHQVNATIAHESGLHARPAVVFVQTAKRFAATITVRNGERRANAKSMAQVLTLGASKGTELVLEAEGEDAEQALQALQVLLAADSREAAS
jgi:phosphocarrier protein HPr